MSFNRMVDDLAQSLLTPEDIGARIIEGPERAATGLAHGIQGYVIPYTDFNNNPAPFYRIRIFDQAIKYIQPKNTSNRVYFPDKVKDLALEAKYLMLTEGEKKAACATKYGFPTAAFGGVESWHNKTLIIPANSEISKAHNSSKLNVKLPSGSEDNEQTADTDTNLASGLINLIDFVSQNKLSLVICYDRDKSGTKFEVQRAAAMLAYELRFRGVPFSHIKQMVLPMLNGDNKIGLDDFLLHSDTESLAQLIKKTLETTNAFPRHPNARDFVNKRLQRTKMSRKEAQQTSMSVLCELDAAGKRFRSKSDELYYFSNNSRALISASLQRSGSDALVNSRFSRQLYFDYGIGHSDSKLMTWLATQFTSEEPIETVEPKKVVTTDREGNICYQINDGQYIRISPNEDKPFLVCDNGHKGVMFESDQVLPLDATELLNELVKQRRNLDTKPFWPEVFKKVRLRIRDAHTTDLLALLFYLSPWVNRWKGTQLPVEMALGEAGSGKSSLYELKLMVMVGEARLRNSPHDMRDWTASILSTGGQHVIDNAYFVDKALKQRVSDEMCRIVTEYSPHIEMRKFYTEADLVRMPVYNTFALTAVQQPFHNTDLLQRSVIIELDKGSESTTYESQWAKNRLEEFGGRTCWIAHHILILHKFLNLAQRFWDNNYPAKHRLMNLEQAMALMARVLGMEGEWVPDTLMKHTVASTSEADWTLEGIGQYADCIRRHNPEQLFTSADISDWCRTNEDYEHNQQLCSSRSLGRYMATNKQLLSMTARLKETGKKNNRMYYKVLRA